MGFLTRARDYQLLSHAKVQARLAGPCDLALVHPETGEPFTTEVLRYGYQVVMLAIAAPGPLKSLEALAMVGPQAFGYSDVYHPLPGDLCSAAAEERMG